MELALLRAMLLFRRGPAHLVLVLQAGSWGFQPKEGVPCSSVWQRLFPGRLEVRQKGRPEWQLVKPALPQRRSILLPLCAEMTSQELPVWTPEVRSWEHVLKGTPDRWLLAPCGGCPGHGVGWGTLGLSVCTLRVLRLWGLWGGMLQDAASQSLTPRKRGLLVSAFFLIALDCAWLLMHMANTWAVAEAIITFDQEAQEETSARTVSLAGWPM